MASPIAVDGEPAHLRAGPEQHAGVLEALDRRPRHEQVGPASPRHEEVVDQLGALAVAEADRQVGEAPEDATVRAADLLADLPTERQHLRSMPHETTRGPVASDSRQKKGLRT